MKKKLTLSTITAAVHLVAVLSVVCFGTVFLSLGILALPAFTAAFIIGKDVIYKRFDVHDGLIGRFFSEFVSNIGMMRYFPLQLLIYLQVLGIIIASETGLSFLFYPMLICISFVSALMIYIITYHVFYSAKPDIITAIIAMLYRVQYFVMVWLLVILVTVFFGIQLMGILLFCGTILIFCTETCAFLGIMGYKKLKNELTEEEKEYFGEDMIKKL